MGDRSHRVIVAFADAARRATSGQDGAFESDVKILNRHTVLLRLNNANNAGKSTPTDPLSPRYYRHLEYDNVGYEYDPNVLREFSHLTDQMFRHKQHSCLVRFASQRCHNMNLMRRIMVAEVDKIMRVLRCRIRSITLEYYDVRKFDMVNMLGMQRQTPTSSSRIMHSTREVFQWLLTEFAVLRHRGTGDDFITLEFVFSDASQKVHNVQLTLFQVFGTDARTDIASFFKTLRSGKNTHATLLTDCIKESFEFRRHMRTLLFFELPLGRERSVPDWMRRMLRIADMAYNNLRVARPARSTLTLLSKPNLCSSTQTTSTETLCKPLIKKLPASKATMPTPRQRHAYDDSKEQQDENDNGHGIVHWYNHIDLKVSEVLLSLEKFYRAMYSNKTQQICQQLNDKEEQKVEADSEGCGDREPLPLNSGAVAEGEARERYHHELAEFKRLDIELDQTGFAATLKSYLSIKSLELAKAEQTVKQREVNNLRRTLINYIKQESLAHD